MKYRIITHGGCTDGFCSAFTFKKHFNTFLETNLSEEDIQNIPVYGIQPRDIQLETFEFTELDIVLDLPKPKTPVLFWCDHHLSAKPEEDLQSHECWREVASNTGLLFDLLVEKGHILNDEEKQFKKVIDIMDSADYSQEDIKQCYYPQESYCTPLQKIHMLGSMFHTRDRFLNYEIYTTLLKEEMGRTPLSSPNIWNFRPKLFHKAQLKAFQEWRDNVDTYIYIDEEAKCVIQDDRLKKYSRGIFDRFYVYLKFPQASYGANFRISDDDMARVGIGSNIFHKDRCKINIGELCHLVGTKFGEGSGGGHFYVGGATIFAEKMDEAIKFILEVMKEGKLPES